MIIDRSKINFMPLIRGPLWDQGQLPRHTYNSVETLLLQYETDRDAICSVLPEPFKPGKSPTVTVLFADNNGVDFMAGGGYRLGAITVAAEFEGEAGHLAGDYVLVMPENDALPITTGREWLGMPKFYSDITPIRACENGRFRCEASLWGHLLFGIEVVQPLRRQNVLIRKAAALKSTQTPAFGYKYVASLGGPPDADYPTVMWNDIRIDELWMGKDGGFYLGKPSEDGIGDFFPLIGALQSLPVRRVMQTLHSHGAMVLRNDKNGRLR